MLKYVYFGTPEISKSVLEGLSSVYGKPVLIVTGQDKKTGRGLAVSANPVKIFGAKENIPVITPTKLKDIEDELKSYNADVAILFAYGKIIPEWLLDLFPNGIINVHPSLLPLYRGPTPIESPILNGEILTGISIMDMDKELDHGDIYIQEEFILEKNTDRKDIESNIIKRAPVLLKNVLENIEHKTVLKTQQDHSKASSTKKITKEDGELKDTESDEIKYRKYKAYIGWPGVYFFKQYNGKNTRFKITSARFDDGKFIIEKIIPENSKESNYTDLF
jgi:methionyl-tRNA formyltransferase